MKRIISLILSSFLVLSSLSSSVNSVTNAKDLTYSTMPQKMQHNEVKDLGFFPIISPYKMNYSSFSDWLKLWLLFNSPEYVQYNHLMNNFSFQSAMLLPALIAKIVVTYKAIEKSLLNVINDKKIGVIKVLDTEPLYESRDIIYTNDLNNWSNNVQILRTLSYKQEVVNEASFELTFSQKIGFEAGVSFIFFEKKITAELSSSQKWTSNVKTSKTYELPSQEFNVGPKMRGVANIVLSSGRYRVNGMITYEISKRNDLFKGLENIVLGLKRFFSFYNEYIQEKILITSKEFSVIKVDSIENPQKFYFNLPLKYEVTGNKLFIDFKEEKLV